MTLNISVETNSVDFQLSQINLNIKSFFFQIQNKQNFEIP